MMLGLIGEEKRMEGTVISDAVNAASRLKGLTKIYFTPIIVSEDTLLSVSNSLKYNYRFIGKVKVKGKSKPIRICDFFHGEDEAIVEMKIKTKHDFEKGIDLYYSREFAEANVYFNSVLKKNPKDSAAQYYFRKAAQYMLNGVPNEWDGTDIMDRK